MKKRLLSAALAFAMVLTMLPLSAFADYDAPDTSDIDGDGTETVKYVSSRDSTHDKVGWYVTHQYAAVPADSTAGTAAKPAKSVDLYLGDQPTGLSVAGKYYKNEKATFTGNVTMNSESTAIATNTSIYSASVGTDDQGNKQIVQGNLKGSVIVIGGTVTIDAVNATSLNLDVYGGTATINGSKLTSVTVTNSSYATYGAEGKVTLGDLPKQLTSLTLNHVELTDSSLEMSHNTTSSAAHTLTLNDVTTSANITMTGTYKTAANVTNTSAQVVSITKSSIGNLTVTGNSSRVALNEMPPNGSSAVSIEGTACTFTFQGGGKIGALTITGSSTGGTNGADLTTAPSSVNVAAGCEVGAINGSLADFSDEKAAGRNTVTINGTTGAINFRNAAITVNGGTVGNITMETGTVSVTGNRATVGDVSLAHDATFTLSGTNCTIGALEVASGGNASSVTFTVPNEPSNVLGTSTKAVSGYSKQTISGGTWLSAVDAKVLSTSLAYQLKTEDSTNGNRYTYYTANQLGEAIIAQGGATGKTLTKIGDSGSAKVVFMNGSNVWGELTSSANVTIQLPTQMNSVSTPYWTDGKFTNLTGNYNVPSGGATLNAGDGAVTGEVTELTGVEVGGTSSDIKATLVGNVITLSGAVNTGDTVFDLTLGTDAVTKDDKGNEVPVEIKVSVIYNPSTKTLTFSNPGSQSLDYGVIIENGFEAIRMGNGTRYTLNGQGLVVRNQDIVVRGIDQSVPDTHYSDHDIEVIVTAPGYTNSDTLKNQVIALINGSNASFNWSNSPAVKQAVNAALATITEANVTSWRQAARTKAWSDNGIRGQSLTATSPTAYNNGTVCLVPYLEVNVTSYQRSTTNPSLTANLTLKWRVEVHPEKGSTDPKANKTANLVNEDGVYIAKTGANLTLADDLGTGVTITFDTGISGATFAHQARTYDYEVKTNAFTVTHAVNGNLGQFVFDTTTPLIAVGTQVAGSTTPTGTLTYFSTLQAAVDAAEDKQLIEISSSYTGATSINMTGKARTIYIQANGKNVVVANASGTLVEVNNAGTLYTIKLNRDNSVAAVTPAAISVSSVSNGSARASVSTAKPGDTVTVTATPNTGYKASAPTVSWSGSNGSGTVTASLSGTNQWTFTVPENAANITVTPNFTVDDGRIFDDVAPTAWYADAVSGCYNAIINGNRLLEGVSDTMFSPDTQLNRAQMVQILWNLAGQPSVTGTCPFPDVAGTRYDWALKPITWAAQKGYVIGYTDGKFHPEVNISRQDMILILYRYVGQPSNLATGNLSAYYDGAKVGSWATEAMRWAITTNILSGTDSVALNGYLSPATKSNRKDAAVTLWQHYSLYGTYSAS